MCDAYIQLIPEYIVDVYNIVYYEGLCENDMTVKDMDMENGIILSSYNRNTYSTKDIAAQGQYEVIEGYNLRNGKGINLSYNRTSITVYKGNIIGRYMG